MTTASTILVRFLLSVGRERQLVLFSRLRKHGVFGFARGPPIWSRSNDTVGHRAGSAALASVVSAAFMTTPLGALIASFLA
jgi:hypothetical protein